MSYRKYTKDEFSDIEKQHNIMILVGNGFDIEILTAFQQKAKTSYENFYHFLEYQNCREENLIYQKMKNEKKKENPLWSDFEDSLISLLNKNVPVESLENDLHEIQGYFSSFFE